MIEYASYRRATFGINLSPLNIWNQLVSFKQQIPSNEEPIRIAQLDKPFSFQYRKS